MIKHILKLKYYFHNRLLSWIIFFIVVFGIFSIIYKVIIYIYDYCYYRPLSCIIITGNRYFTSNDDIYNLILKLGTLGTFITQDVNIIYKQVKQLPWIRQVSVRKQWPDILKIHLVEHIPIAYWNDKLIISTMGTLLQVSKEQICRNHDNRIDEIPIFYGFNGKEQNILNNYLIFNAILQSNKFQIKSIKMDMCYSWQLVLKNGICLKLGRDNLIERLSYFIKVYPILIQEIDKKNKYIDYIDLRYTSGFAIKWIYNVVVSFIL